MTGQDWADCIGLHASASPLRERLSEVGLDDPADVNELPDFGLTLHFRADRLYCVAFDLLDFSGPLPGEIPAHGPLPAGFESQVDASGMTTFRRELGGLVVSVLEDHGIRFSVDVAALGDLDTLPPHPMSSLWTPSQEPPPPSPSWVPGIPIGYKTQWFAARTADVPALQSALSLDGDLQECEPEVVRSSQVPFISAERAGWRLVVGSVADDPESGFQLARRASDELGTRVCFFWSDRVTGSYAWSILEGGRTVRAWWTEDGHVRVDEGEALRDEPDSMSEEALRDIARDVSVAPVVPGAPGFAVR